MIGLFFFFLCLCLSVSSVTSYPCNYYEYFLSSNNGTLNSSDYPYNTCVKWSITGSSGLKILLQFLYFRIPGDCDKNYVLIAATTKQLYCRDSMTIAPFEFEFSNSETNITITYHSDYKWRDDLGFKLFYSLSYYLTTTQQPANGSQLDTCHFNMSTLQGKISNTDVVYHAVRRCGYFYWHLHYYDQFAHYGNYELTIETFELLSGDVLHFYDGDSESSQFIGAFTKGLLTPHQLSSSGSSMFIKYVTKSVNEYLRSNFTIIFSVNPTCPPDFLNCLYGESACYPSSKQCDGVWDCPFHGGDEKGCPNKCEKGEFSCNSSSHFCYKESERCNGRGTCANYADEMGCTPAQCSAEKGLFLCSNGRCIYEKWQCDRTNDCKDNSDEINCAPLASPRVIVAAVVGSLICVLLLVISLGCVCKLYNMRINNMRRVTHHETPLSRQLAEMFHRRAPPPPYHEAMLTSRPYNEACVELSTQEENDLNGQINRGFVSEQSSSQFAVPGDRPQRERRRCRHGRRLREMNQTPAAQDENLSISTDAMGAEMDVLNADLTLSQPPPYNTAGLLLSEEASLAESSDDDSGAENWQAGEDNSPVDSLYETSQRNILLDPARRSYQHTFGSNIEETEVDSDKDNDTTSTYLSLYSTPEGVKVESSQLTMLDEDSDIDCILLMEDGTENISDDTAFDTVCILSNPGLEQQ